MKKTVWILSALVLSLLFAFTGCDDAIVDVGTSGTGSEQSSAETEIEEEDISPEIVRADTISDKWADDGVLKILLIGNSFAEDTAEFSWEIAKSLGIENVVIGLLAIGGCSLNRHYKSATENIPDYSYRVKSDGKWVISSNYRIGDGIRNENWDVISIQQVSGLAGKAQSYGALEGLIDFVTENCPDAEIIWNCTWAYESNAPTPDFAHYSRDQLTMYNAIISVAKDLIEKNARISLIVPTGTAVQNIRTAIGSNISRDGYHLTYAGRYLVALTFIHKLTGLDISEVEFSAGLYEETKQLCIRAAMSAVKDPYTVTPIDLA